MKRQYKAYLSTSGDYSYYLNEYNKLGMDEDSKIFHEKFSNSLREVVLNMEVETDTGETWILGVFEVPLETPVKE